MADMKYALGCIKDPVDDRDKLFKSYKPIFIDLPKSTQTLLPHVPNAIDQLERSCCTGASASRAGKAYMNSIGYQWNHMPSCFYLYNMTRVFEKTPLDDDAGAIIRDIFKVWNLNGVCPEDSNKEWSMPFSAKDDTWKTMPNAKQIEHAAKHKVQYLRLGSNQNEIKSALHQGFPVVIGINVPESMMGKKTAEDGVIKRSGQSMGGHALWLHSYGNYKDDYADGLNSWGLDWGSKLNGKGGNFHVKFKDLCDPKFCNDLWAITGYS